MKELIGTLVSVHTEEDQGQDAPAQSVGGKPEEEGRDDEEGEEELQGRNAHAP